MARRRGKSVAFDAIYQTNILRCVVHISWLGEGTKHTWCLRPRLVCSVLVNSDTLTVNYGVKQNQFTKPTSELPR